MNSDKNAARLLGAAFLFVAVLSLLSGLLHSSLGVAVSGPPDSMSETMIMIADTPTTMQMSIVGYLIEAIAIVLLATLLWTALKIPNRRIARWAFGLWLIQAAMLAAREVSLFSLLHLSRQFAEAGAPDPSYFLTLGSLFYGAFQFGYNVQMVFYCMGGILFYYLFIKSRYVPRLLSVWGLAAAFLAFIGTLLMFFDYSVPLYLFLPVLPFELAIGVWLIVKGFDESAFASELPETG